LTTTEEKYMNKSLGKVLLSLLLAWLIPCQFAWGLDREKPDQIDVIVFPNIQYDAVEDIFTYNYSLTSTEKSLQEVDSLVILTDKFYSRTNPAQGWFALKFPHRNPPSGVPPCVVWSAGYGDLPIGKDVSIPGIPLPPYAIKPGNSLAGFSFESKEPPGVATFFSKGWVKIPDYTEEPPAEGPPPPLEFGHDRFKGITVAPVVVTDTSSGGLIDRLITLKDSMPGYGWIANQGIINSLNVKLKAAKESIAKGNNKTASNQLSAFINELDAQKGKQVNENAWALLKANAEFLIH